MQGERQMIWYTPGLNGDIASRLASSDVPVSLRHKITAALVQLGALCFPLLLFVILCKIFPQIKNFILLWYGGAVFCLSFILCMFIWIHGCIMLKKWYIALLLSFGMIAGYFFILV